MDRQKLIEITQKQLNAKVLNVRVAKGGLAHYVYKVTTKKGNVYVKVRGKHFSMLPHIAMDPTLIKFEKQALQILSKIDAKTFPRLLGSDLKNNLIIMSDIMPNDRTFEVDLNSGVVTKKDSENLGRTLALIHLKLSKIEKILINRDEQFYQKLLFYRFGIRSNTALDELIVDLKKLPKQLILGDLSPKNINLSAKGDYSFCDFENFHYGNTITDLGFLAAGIIIHNLNNRKRGVSLLNAFLKGYSNILSTRNEEGLIKKIVLGIILYRLDNPIIPYSLPISSNRKIGIVKNINKLLDKEKNISWRELAQAVYK